MPVRDYGVWCATPTRYTVQRDAQDSRSPHLTLYFNDGSGNQKSAAINVKSTGTDSRLVYWVDRNFDHPLTESLRQLDPGFHEVSDGDNSDAGLALDYQRTDPPLLDFSQGRLLPHDLPGPNNDIVDELVPDVEQAISDRENKVYIFGSSYTTGIHDVHMNQGSLPRFDNGVGQDGALVFYFAKDDRFEAVFLAFASQETPTNDTTGLALPDSQPLSEIARGTSAS